jgi:hypothetical protein
MLEAQSMATVITLVGPNLWQTYWYLPVGTKNFSCDRVLVRGSSFWAVTPIQVEDALFINLKILDPTM